MLKYSYDPLGQRIKTEYRGQITGNSKAGKITKYLMSGMIEQARLEGNSKFKALNPKQIRNLNEKILTIRIII